MYTEIPHALIENGINLLQSFDLGQYQSTFAQWISAKKKDQLPPTAAPIPSTSTGGQPTKGTQRAMSCKCRQLKNKNINLF